MNLEMKPSRVYSRALVAAIVPAIEERMQKLRNIIDSIVLIKDATLVTRKTLISSYIHTLIATTTIL